MDPVANLERQRELAADILDITATPIDLSHQPDLRWKAEELAELVQSLDEWQQNGGFDPYVPADEFPVEAESYYGQTFNSPNLDMGPGPHIGTDDGGELC